MTTTTLEEKKIDTPEEAKARRNAEYMAMLDESFQQSKSDQVVTMSFEEWEERFCNE